MTTATLTAGLAARPDPARDRGGKPVPERIAEILAILAVLSEYGRHLAATIEHRALWRGFATIAQFFGTATVPVMLAHIQRGIMRAAALERVLRARAKRGRDLLVRPYVYARYTTLSTDPSSAPPVTPPQAPQAPPPEASRQQPAEAQPQKATRPPRRPASDEPLTLDNLPSMAELEREVRRHPIGRTLVAICQDLGVAPALCSTPFWNRLFNAIHWYRGNFAGVTLEMRRRANQLEQDGWRYPNIGVPEETLDGVRRVLGFFVGEPPFDPHRPAPAANPPAAEPPATMAARDAPAAVATGPPRPA